MEKDTFSVEKPAWIVPFSALLRLPPRVLAADRKSGDDEREIGRGTTGPSGRQSSSEYTADREMVSQRILVILNDFNILIDYK